jgi:hypothetical protein
MFYSMNSLGNSKLVWLILFLSFLPTTLAAPKTSAFPQISFTIFSTFIQDTLPSDVSLSTVLLLILTLVENTDLLNLHHRQKHPKYPGEKQGGGDTGWMRALAHALKSRISLSSLFPIPEDAALKKTAQWLDDLAEVLDLTTYSSSGKFRQLLKHVSLEAITPVRTICPPNPSCNTESCAPYHLNNITISSSMAPVSLILGTHVHTGYVLGGECSHCLTHYYADHESFRPDASSPQRAKFYLNDARFLQIGQSIWADRIFTRSILQAIYTFHGSANTCMLFWNRSFARTGPRTRTLSRRQIWETFTQESIRTVAQSQKRDFTLPATAKNEVVLDQVCLRL